MKSIRSNTKQIGASTVDILIYVTVIIAILLFVVTKVPDIRNGLRISAFQSDASTIDSATYRWKA